MKCPKCNATYKSEVKSCPKCGYVFDMDDVKKYSLLFNTDLLEVYYPKDEKEKKSEISLYYAFFTIFYAVYKRMYRCAIYTTIGFLIFIKYYPRALSIIFGTAGFQFFLVVFLLIGSISPYFYYIYNFNRLQVDRRKMKINKLIKNNPDKSREEIKELVKKDNEGNTKGLIITIVLAFFYLVYKLFLS